MTYVVLILASLTLLAGFYALAALEARRGARVVLPGVRGLLDTHLNRFEYIAAHVDFSAFAREETLRVVTRAVHRAAHASLRGVRATERLLARLVRRLRTHQALDTAPSAQVREFVQTLSDFKGRLKAPTHAKLPE